MEKSKSGSQRIHEILCQKEYDFTFTYNTLMQMIKSIDPTITDGMVGGFIARATKKGMLEYTNLIGKNSNYKAYKLIDKEAWNFHSGGVGSTKGRDVHMPTRKITSTFENASPDELKNVGHKTQQMSLFNRVIEQKMIKTSVSDRLLDIATEVSELEKKSLKDYSTNELLEEIKTRVK